MATAAGRMPAGLKVGIDWAGNPTFRHDRARSIGLARMLPLLAQSGVQFFSLQKDLREGDAEILRSRPGLDERSAPRLESFADTAAIISQLDLVISSDTSVVHLAGALGKPVWILLQRVPDWRWLLDRDDSPWYPTARLFRQTGDRRLERRDREGGVGRIARAAGRSRDAGASAEQARPERRRIVKIDLPGAALS